MPRRLSSALVIVSLVLAAFTAHVTRTNGQSHFLATQRYEDVYYLPPPDWLQVFSLGHREALAGLIWLRALIYFGDEIIHRGQVQNLYNYTDAMLALDPYFKRVYQWVSSTALYRTGDVGERDARRAIAYLERGVRLFPDDGELAWTLGATYLYELPPLMPIAKRDEVRERGLEHLQVAARLGAGPAWLVLSTATVLGRLGKREQQIAHLEEVYDQVSDPAVKEQIELRLTKLRSAAFAEALRRTNEELEQARLRDFPYVDRELYLLLAPKPPFDGTALLLRNFDPEVDRWSESESSAGAEPTPP